MGENEKPDVNTNSAEFRQGVEAGLNSEEDTRNWQAGNELGQELKEGELEEPVKEATREESSVPLFLRNSSEGKKGTFQDEKDGMGE